MGVYDSISDPGGLIQNAQSGVLGANNYNAATPQYSDPTAGYAAPSSAPSASATGTGYNASSAAAQGYGATDASANGYTATDVKAPDPMGVGTNQTVQGQLAGILSSNSPLMQYAYNQALAGANDRGLLNSSMAIGAAQNAVYSNALPIAQADAGTYQNTALANFNAANQNAQANAAAANQASQFGAQAQNTASLQNAQFQNAASQFGAQAQNTAALQNAQFQNTASQFGAQAQNTASLQNAQNATQLQNTTMNNATALQQTGMSTATQRFVSQLSANSQAAIAAAHDANSAAMANSQAAQSMFNQYLTNVGNIDANPNMNADAKAAAIQTQTQIFNGAVAGLRAASPGVPDVSSALDFGTSSNSDSNSNSNSNTVTDVSSYLWGDGSS